MTATTPSRPGRPRDSRRDEEILAAVLRLLEDMSYSELTIAAIARSAGVGKPTLYLRWPSKASVVADAVVRVMSADPFPDLGDVRSDLVAGLREMIHRFATTAAGRVLPGPGRRSARRPGAARRVPRALLPAPAALGAAQRWSAVWSAGSSPPA